MEIGPAHLNSIHEAVLYSHWTATFTTFVFLNAYGATGLVVDVVYNTSHNEHDWNLLHSSCCGNTSD